MNKIGSPLILIAWLSLATSIQSQDAEPISRSAVDDLGSRLAEAIDPLVSSAIADGETPGAVVCIGSRSGVEFVKAYGDRQTQPHREPMTVDTVFDLASLTKPIATATSVMLLIEKGSLNLDNLAATRWPEFGENEKTIVTIKQLLTHTSGLIPDNSLRDYKDGTDAALRNICKLKPVSEPGSKFRYSDVGFIVLGELVQRVSGRGLHEFTQERIFRPLGMSDTGFIPDEALRLRCAATEQQDGQWLKGTVHDPRAAAMDGVAGHAGLFSTAGDLAIFARMLLADGSLDSVQIISSETIQQLTVPVEVQDGQGKPAGLRTPGWDMQTGYSTNRGSTMSKRAFGHGGFTGTSFWVDPELDLFVIFLSTRLHPDGKGSVNRLAGKIGTIAATAHRESQKRGSSKH